MEKIQKNMGQVLWHLKTALKLITQAPMGMVKEFSPRTLSIIGRYANDSATVACAPFKKFEKLQALLEETAEASQLIDKYNQVKAAHLALEEAITKNNTKAMDIDMDIIRARYEIARKDLEKARENYHKAIKNVPSGEWNTHAREVYVFQLPPKTCYGKWFRRKCRSNCGKYFTQYSQAAREKAKEALAGNFHESFFNFQYFLEYFKRSRGAC